jgi:hypothetical protein
MAFANSAITDIIATTIQSRSGVLADNLTQNNAVLQRLNSKGNVRPFSGGNVILEEIMYNDPNTNNVNSYSGYEVLNITPDSPISAAQFSITQYADSVTMSGLEMLQNSSKEAIIDLLDGRMQVSEARLLNRISGDIYGDGTGNGGKNITGLAAAVAVANTTGTYGGINRANWTFWQNQSSTGADSSTVIQAAMTSAAIKSVRGTDKVDLIIAGNTLYQRYVASLQAIQRNFVPIGGERQSINQDAIVKLYGWAGNLTCSNASLQGILSGT